MSGHKTSHNKFKNIKTTQGIFSDQDRIKLVMNYQKKKKNMWKLNNILLNECVEEDFSREALIKL